MGSGNCRAFCPQATTGKETELVHKISATTDPNQILLFQRNEINGSPNQSDSARENRIVEWDINSETPSTRKINAEKPADVESKYVENHIVVPSLIVSKKLTDSVKTLLRKELPESPLLNDSTSWYLLPTANYYSGELQAGKPVKLGTYLLSDGTVYYGQSKEDRPDGMGVLVSSEGVLKGEFSKGQASGKCRLQSKDTIAEGQWVEGYLIEGKITTKEFIYEGQMKKGAPEGKGNYKHFLSNLSYEGDFRKGIFDGNGILKTPSYVYRGQFKQGKKHGIGSLEYLRKNQHSDVNKGQWKMDVLVH